jgi:hypothetical protein
MATSGSEDDEAQDYLRLLREGTRDEKIWARSRLSLIFERRGMLEEATELLEANGRAGVRDRALFTQLASLYRRLGRHDDADAAMAEASKAGKAMSLSPIRPADRSIVACDPDQCAYCGHRNSDRRVLCKGCHRPWRGEVDAPPAGGAVTVSRAAPAGARPSSVFLVRNVDPGQDRIALQRVAGEVGTILTPNEEILYIALQNRTALSMKKDSAVATSNRLILYRPSMLGRVTFADFPWEDVVNVTIRDGLISSELQAEVSGGRREVVGNLDKAQTRRLYSVCQQKEQEWREKRRARRMEEDRARAGGVQVNVPVLQAGAEGNPGEQDPVARLAKAKAMLDQGLISEAEYESLKAKIIASF